jgi:hypothetical protein
MATWCWKENTYDHQVSGHVPRPEFVFCSHQLGCPFNIVVGMIYFQIHVLSVHCISKEGGTGVKRGSVCNTYQADERCNMDLCINFIACCISTGRGIYMMLNSSLMDEEEPATRQKARKCFICGVWTIQRSCAFFRTIP